LLIGPELADILSALADCGLPLGNAAMAAPVTDICR
jgi:hypothetical protein